MTVMPENDMSATQVLAGRARTYLQRIAARGEPITYKALAQALELEPPNTIHQVTEALEWLMREDAANGHPFIAALVISRARSGLPPAFSTSPRNWGISTATLRGRTRRRLTVPCSMQQSHFGA